MRDELTAFVARHFSTIITAENRASLQAAWAHSNQTQKFNDSRELAILNIPKEMHKKFIQDLMRTYGPTVVESAAYKTIIKPAFSCEIHTISLSDSVDIEQLLKPPAWEKTTWGSHIPRPDVFKPHSQSVWSDSTAAFRSYKPAIPAVTVSTTAGAGAAFFVPAGRDVVLDSDGDWVVIKP